MKMSYKVQVDAPSAQVWKVIAHDFHNVDQWASSVNHAAVRQAGPAPGGAPLASAGRACETSLGGFKETIVKYDERKQHLAYQAEGEKMPFFVKRMVNNWVVKPQGTKQSLVDMRLEVELMPVIGTMMKPMMKMQLGKVLREATEELKHFIETGKPHPRKVAAMETYRSSKN